MDNATPTAPADTEKAKRERTKIEFPYSDLESAVEMIRTLQSRAGTSCELTQLAGWMNQTATGGTFRSRLGAAKLFGLVETEQGRVSLTNLGRDAADDVKGQAAWASAFLNAPLFVAMYDQFQGYALPPAAAIERQMEQLGVPSKQKERARQIFVKSAQFAGYIADNGRIIKPVHAAPPLPADPQERKRNGGGGGDGISLDPLLMALLRMIPPTGQPWPKEQRLRWFRTFAMNVSQVYDTPESAVDLKIEEQKPAP